MAKKSQAIDWCFILICVIIYQFKVQSCCFTSRLTASVILGQVHNIVTLGSEPLPLPFEKC